MKNHLVVALVESPLSAFEFGCVVEIFGLDRGLGVPWYDFAVATAEPGAIAVGGGLELRVPHGLDLLDRADTIVVPSWDSDRSPSREIVAGLRTAAARGARLISICSGAFALAAAGLLDGMRATTHWLHVDGFRQRFPDVDWEADVLYVDQGRIITAAGAAAGLDMLLHLIRRDHGVAVCNAVARRINIPPHREGGQAQFIPRPVARPHDGRLSEVMDWMRQHAGNAHSIGALAERAAMSPRTFFRKFKEATGLAPYQWLLQERIGIAKDLLELGGRTIEEIAFEAGFGAAETLRHHFKLVVGRTPAEYQRMFGGRALALSQAAA